MPSNEIYAGINVTGTKLQFVKFLYSETDNSFSLEKVDEEKYDKTADFENYDEFGYLFLEALKKLIGRNNSLAGQARLSLPSDFFKIFKTRIDARLHDSEADEFLRLQRGILYPYLKSGAIIRRIDLYNADKTAAVCLDKELFTIIRKGFAGHGIKVEQADHAHSAINFLYSRKAKQDGGYTISFHISVNYVSVIKLLDGKLLDIYQVPKEEKKKDIDIVSEEIRKFSENLRAQGKDSGGIIVTDDNYKKEKIDFLEKEAGRKITVFNPLEEMNYLAGNKSAQQPAELYKFAAAGAIAVSKTR